MIELPKKRKVEETIKAEKPEEVVAEVPTGGPVGWEEPILKTEPSKEEVAEKTSEDDKALTEKVKAEIFTTKPEVAPEPVKEEKLPKGMVKVKVLVGTLKFDEFTYEKGDVFTVSRKRTEGFDPRFFEIIK